MSFSYFHWKTIESVTAGQLNLEDVKKNFLYQLCYVILPD